MYKKILFILTFVFLTSINAKENAEIFEILANDVKTKNDIVIATGNVVIFSKTYYISAQKIVYDKNKNTFELFDDVVILKDNNVQSQSDYAFLELENDKLIQNPVLLLENSSNIWISADGADKTNNQFKIEDSIVSSCDCINPDWSLKFSEGNYDTEEKWISTYNTRLYIKDVPVFYTPYFGFPTDRSRRSGLLIPRIGYSSSEGFFYSQPIYLAPAPNYDFEFIPQIRTSRGYGLYTNFRLADSPSSYLNIKAGYFKEKTSYADEFSLENDKHFGYNIDYTRSNLFSKGEDEDELYLSINWLNDIEYMYLQDNSFNIDSEQKIKSKINYYYDTPEYYFGSYFKFYLDTKLDSNDSTLQELPELQMHSYKRSLFFDKLVYSTDLKYTNYTRNEGLTADKYELNVPISYTISMFDDYLYLTLKNELKAIKLNYFNETDNYENATYLENKYLINLSTDLLKAYTSYIHTLNLSAELSSPDVLRQDGDLYSINTTTDELIPYSVNKEQKTVTFSLNHSLYDKENLEQIINHKIKQSIIYDSFDNTDLGDLENEITVNYLLGNFQNRVVYSNLDNELVESTTSFSLDYSNYFLKLSYYMSKNTPNSSKENLESYVVNTGFNFLNDYSIAYYENYNIEESLRNKQGIRFGVNDKCWRVDLSFEKRIEPTSSTNLSAIEQDIVYLTLTLKPFGALKVQ